MEDKKRTGHTDYRTTGMVLETLAKMTSPTVSFLDLTGKIVSGHTLKHLLAAVSPAVAIYYLCVRKVIA